MEFQDYYAVLGLPRTASQTDIKKAFRKLARQHHPDTNTGDAKAEQRFKEVNEANAVLSDPEKRALYDRLGKDWEAYSRAGAAAGAAAGARGTAGGADPFAGFAGFGAPAGGGNIRYEFRTRGDPGEFSDFFNVFFGGASEPLSGAGAGRGRRRSGSDSPTFEEILAGMGMAPDGTPATGRTSTGRSQARRPAAEATAEITIQEADQGTTRLIEVDGRRLEVTIPAGADTGTRIRLTGKAPGGGDIHVVVRQASDPVFKRRGADLERELPLTLEEALLGGEVPVRTPRGRVLLMIPAGTQTGRTFRLRGQGLPRFKGEGRGDLLARARVVLPTNLSDEAAAAARPFLDLADQPNPRTNETA